MKNIKYYILFLIAAIIFTGCSKPANTVNQSSTSSSSSDTSGNKSAEGIDKAVGEAVKSSGKDYLNGEIATEGHEILEAEEKGNIITVYTISSFGYFGFENGVFTKISGSGAIPTVITFAQNADSTYSLTEYKEPADGSDNIKSIKRMFPERLWDKVTSPDASVYSKLAAQQEGQAEQYLKSIGRTARVDSNYVEKKLPNINTAASNKLFTEMIKDDLFLMNCPYWLGTKEKLENGVRFIYETSQSKTNDGCDLITFRKTKVDGTVSEERRYKIAGSEPVLQ